MTKRDIGQEILDGLREVKAGGGTYTYVEGVKPPKEIRNGLDMSQDEFAIFMGISKRTLQEWEQGRRKPTGSAISLLRIAQRSPQTFVTLGGTDFQGIRR